MPSRAIHFVLPRRSNIKIAFASILCTLTGASTVFGDDSIDNCRDLFTRCLGLTSSIEATECLRDAKSRCAAPGSGGLGQNNATSCPDGKRSVMVLTCRCENYQRPFTDKSCDPCEPHGTHFECE